MMFNQFQRIILVIFIMNLIYFSVFSKISQERVDDFLNDKVKIDKAINHQKLSNYLNKIMMKKDNIVDKDMIFLDEKDLNPNNKDLNLSDSQKKNNIELKARVLALKWALNNKNKKELKPYHVKNGEEKIPNWKTFLVLMVGKDEDYVLKKVCFPDKQGDNYGIVREFNKSCKEKVKKIEDYKVFEKENKNKLNSIKKGDSNIENKPQKNENLSQIKNGKITSKLDNKTIISDKFVKKEKEKVKNNILDNQETNNKFISNFDSFNNKNIIADFSSKGSSNLKESGKNNYFAHKDKVDIKLFTKLKNQNLNLLKKIEEIEKNIKKEKKISYKDLLKLKEQNQKIIDKIQAIENSHFVNATNQNINEKQTFSPKNYEINNVDDNHNNNYDSPNKYGPNDKKNIIMETQKSKIEYENEITKKNNEILPESQKLNDFNIDNSEKLNDEQVKKFIQNLKVKNAMNKINEIKNLKIINSNKIEKIHKDNEKILNKLNNYINSENNNVEVEKTQAKEDIDHAIEKLFDDDTSSDSDKNNQKTSPLINLQNNPAQEKNKFSPNNQDNSNDSEELDDPFEENIDKYHPQRQNNYSPLKNSHQSYPRNNYHDVINNNSRVRYDNNINPLNNKHNRRNNNFDNNYNHYNYINYPNNRIRYNQNYNNHFNNNNPLINYNNQLRSNQVFNDEISNKDNFNSYRSRKMIKNSDLNNGFNRINPLGNQINLKRQNSNNFNPNFIYNRPLNYPINNRLKNYRNSYNDNKYENYNSLALDNSNTQFNTINNNIKKDFIDKNYYARIHRNRLNHQRPNYPSNMNVPFKPKFNYENQLKPNNEVNENSFHAGFDDERFPSKNEDSQNNLELRHIERPLMRKKLNLNYDNSRAKETNKFDILDDHLNRNTLGIEDHLHKNIVEEDQEYDGLHKIVTNKISLPSKTLEKVKNSELAK